MRPTLKTPGYQLLQLKCDELLSNFAFNFNLHRYSAEEPRARRGVEGRGFHSTTSQLNLSAFYGIGGVRKGRCSPC